MNITRLSSFITIPVFFSLLIITGCGGPKPVPDVTYTIPDQPEISTGYTEKPGWATSEFAVAAANPLATDAGYQILKSGGSALDAAIAVQLVLALAEPQSSGIGGGAFLLHWDGTEVIAYNGREVAPSGADENLFIDDDGEPLSFSESVNSGLSVGVPGTLAMLEAAHQRHGTLPWADLFKPAITLAEEGFSLSPRLHDQLEDDRTLRNDDIARAFYYDEDGDPHPVGYPLRNPALAEILKRVSEEGTSAFYEGKIPESIVSRVQGHPRPGPMTVEDINNYPSQDFQTEPMCTDWRSWSICGFPPPSSGHIAIMQMLGIMEELEPPTVALADSTPSAQWLHQYLEAAKLAFADRGLYVADPDFVDPPAGSWNSLLDTDYLAQRAGLISDVSMDEADPGVPGGLSSIYGLHPDQPEMGTSHISIIDSDGNAVAMTTTIEQGFGSRIMSDGGTGLPGGFHLNNELTDFSRTPVDDEGRPIANRVEAGKRPRSSMSPTLVFDRETGELVSSLGSPGGAAIIHYTAKALIGMLDWELNAQEAINLPNFANYNGPSLLEAGRFSAEVIEALEAMEHEIIEQDLTSGLQAIQKTDNGFFGGADPRREGIVMGD
ncbi:MAG: gamma-glutamyltransferase [Balneolales bacterium]